jgi:hypothetical protein
MSTAPRHPLPFLSAFGCLLLAGCATSYQRVGATGGFTDMRLAPDVFRITFHGNGYTSRERAQDFALLRASELVLENGFTHFALLDEQQSSTPWVYSTPSTARTTSYGWGDTTGTIHGNTFHGNSYLAGISTTTYTPGQTYIGFKPTTGLLIRAFAEKPRDIAVFDAAFLREQIVGNYKLKLKDTSEPGVAMNQPSPARQPSPSTRR